jgi:hypothetical protein
MQLLFFYNIIKFVWIFHCFLAEVAKIKIQLKGDFYFFLFGDHFSSACQHLEQNMLFFINKTDWTSMEQAQAFYSFWDYNWTCRYMKKKSLCCHVLFCQCKNKWIKVNIIILQYIVDWCIQTYLYSVYCNFFVLPLMCWLI